MHFSTISGAAVLLALTPSVLAVGSATLVNSCGFDIYYVADQGTYGGMTALSPGGTFTTPYDDQGQGVSIKIAPSDNLGGPISQFEFTWADGKINYDISNINGQPFSGNGMTLSPSVSNDPGNPTCLPVDCPAESGGTCSAAYNAPNDVDTMVCDDSVSLTMVVCTGGSSAPSSTTTGGEPSTTTPSSSAPTSTWGGNYEREAVPAIHSHHRAHTRHFPRK